MPSETLLFHCQHALGIGHLTRSFALAQALAHDFRVVFLNGGPLPPGLPVPSGIELVDLPPLGMDERHALVSRAEGVTVIDALAGRRAVIERAMRRHRPALVLVELFPFGRKKLTGEVLAMVRAARHARADAKVACSLRDILVDTRSDQQQHDDRARWLADRYFDLVLVHADPALARLEDSFRPTRPLHVPVHYTGYVVPARDAARQPRGRHVLVSAGGGLVGAPLLQAALDAHARLPAPPRLRLVAGPFLPEADWAALQQAAGRPGVELVRQVPDLAAEMRNARASISQCGYNTALDILVSGVPALVVPYAAGRENEQTVRAGKLAARGALLHLPTQELSGATLAAAFDRLLAFTPAPNALALDGAARSAALLREVAEPAWA
jgi:predicted glycosyltransferase